MTISNRAPTLSPAASPTTPERPADAAPVDAPVVAEPTGGPTRSWLEGAAPVRRADSTFQAASGAAAAAVVPEAAALTASAVSPRERNLGAWAQTLFVAPGAAPELPEPLPPYDGERSSDGKLMVRVEGGAGLVPSGTSLEALRGRAFAPSGGGAVKPGPVTLFITGIQTTADWQARHAQALADQGHHVIPLRNATHPAPTVPESAVRDVLQARADVALADAKELGGVDPTTVNPAVRSLMTTLMQELRAGRPVHLVGHSQGAAIISAALTLVKHVIDGGQPAPTGVDDAAWAAERKVMATAFEASRVESLGGFARRYPPGPTYVHFINHGDSVPQAPNMEGGLLTGTPDEADVQARAGGDKATVVLFDHPGSGEPVIGAHSLADAYLPTRRAQGDVPLDGPRLRLNVKSVEQALARLGIKDEDARALLQEHPLMGFGWNARGFERLVHAIRWEQTRFPHVPTLTYLREALRQGKRDHGGVTRFIQELQANGVEFDDPREVLGTYRVRVTVRRADTLPR